MDDQDEMVQLAREDLGRRYFPFSKHVRFPQWQMAPFGFLVLALLLIGCAPSAVISQATPSHAIRPVRFSRSAGCNKRSPFLPGTSQEEMVHQAGQARWLLLHIPAHYRSTLGYPLILSFHGHGSNAEAQERLSGFSQLADQAGFIVAYPQGVRGADGKAGWNTGPWNYPHSNDLAFTAAALSSIQGQLCVNLRRIYATGFSNGGGMTMVLACTMAATFAAIAIVSGGIHPVAGGCHPVRAVSLLEIHGTADQIVTYNGNALNDHEPPVQQTLSTWAELDGCTHQPVISSPLVQVLIERWQDCRDGTAVLHYRLAGGVHTWPRSGIAPRIDGHSIHATTVIWQFLQAYSLPETVHPSDHPIPSVLSNLLHPMRWNQIYSIASPG
jgi:polyhydroxybutyrate depolymerase